VFFVTLCLTACDTSEPASFRSSRLDADASTDEIPASWEGDWTWENDLGTPIDTGTTVQPAQTCSAGQRFGDTVRISVSSGLIADCEAGHIIHLWDADGVEHLSEPDRTISLDLTTHSFGWIAFNITCGSNGGHAMDWSKTTSSDLIERGLIAITSEDENITPYLKLCYSTDGILLPRFPIECGTDPCS